MMYVERNIFFSAVEKTRKVTRYWWFSGDMQRCVSGFLQLYHLFLPNFSYDHEYTLTATVQQGDRTNSSSVTMSIGSFITEDGEILSAILKQEAEMLYAKLAKKD